MVKGGKELRNVGLVVLALALPPAATVGGVWWASRGGPEIATRLWVLLPILGIFLIQPAMDHWVPRLVFSLAYFCLSVVSCLFVGLACACGFGRGCL